MKMNANELKKAYTEAEIAITAVKRAGKSDVHVIGRSGKAMLDLAIAAEIFEKILCENAKYFRSKREARIELIEMMEEMCEVAFGGEDNEKVS